MQSTGEGSRLTTDIPARLDRLPWSSWHWMVLIGLGTVWILDGLEVTIVGSLSSALHKAGSGLGLTSFEIGFAGAIYVIGACVGALVFGHLTDRFGRKRLFLITLGIYLVGTVLTAFSLSPIWYFACRFITGSGIGGEYAAINSAIDELIPSKYRGRIDVIVNGSFWLGAAAGALATIPLLTPGLLPVWLGWRIAFALGAILGLAILLVRRNVPESPRWLFIHGRGEQAESVVRSIESRIGDERDSALSSVDEKITVRQRKSIGIGEIARTVFVSYPRRTVLCFALFIGQAFLYNAFFFTYGDVLGTYFHVSGGVVGYYIAAFAASNFLGPLVLGKMFDEVGRVRMIAGTYLVSGALLVVTALLIGGLSALTLTAMGMVTFFFASAGASSAYLTASEVFPMETRALCIAFSYAIGTAAGGIVGPLLFGALIQAGSKTGNLGPVAIGYVIAGCVMIACGITETFLGVSAERQGLERIAKPLSAVGAST